MLRGELHQLTGSLVEETAAGAPLTARAENRDVPARDEHRREVEESLVDVPDRLETLKRKLNERLKVVPPAANDTAREDRESR
jgi:hypothetical protein